MTAEQIISEIELLSPEEDAKVVRFAYRLDAERQLTGKELSTLAERMVESTDPTQTAVWPLGVWDESNLIILTNGFAKKTQKTPSREIELAVQRRRDYLNRKAKQ